VKPIETSRRVKSQYQGRTRNGDEPVSVICPTPSALDDAQCRFQLAAMNNTEPSATDVAAFEKDLRERRVHVLIYNSQATEALTKRMLKFPRFTPCRALASLRRCRRQDLPDMDDVATRRVVVACREKHNDVLVRLEVRALRRLAMTVSMSMSVKAGALEVEHVALELGGRPILKEPASRSRRASLSACWVRTAPAKPR